MTCELFEIKVKGQPAKVPSACIEGNRVVVTGRWFRTAWIHDEDWLVGARLQDPDSFLASLRDSGLQADVFTFVQKLPDVKPRYAYRMEWDNVAAIPLTTYAEWEQNVSHDMRKDLKRARKEKVVVRPVEFTDELVQGIVEINNEAEMRQGVPFVHYGKPFETVKKEYETFRERSLFLGAYHKEELIGIMKIVHVGELACMLEIMSKTRCHGKRPTNALIAKAVETCTEAGSSYLTYGKYVYGNKRKSSLTDFKHRNGFLQIFVPRYFVPLTLRGKLGLPFGIHRGLLGLLPADAISFLLVLRSWLRRQQAQHPLLARKTGSKAGAPPLPPSDEPTGRQTCQESWE